MSTAVDKLSRLKDSIASAKTSLARLEERQEVKLEEARKFGARSLQSAKRVRDVLKAECEELENKLERGLQELEREYDW